MSHFLSKFHLQERPKSDQKHDQNTTKHDPTRHRFFEIFERATRHDYRNGWSAPTLARRGILWFISLHTISCEFGNDIGQMGPRRIMSLHE